ncbi:MAG TPA: glycosyltransferase family 2 protein [bacterium (Candidatus Stahlbacteria)]|nr:glycosyltransferase family 2 protein [Candidatus Stahlbacteria bacterium]
MIEALVINYNSGDIILQCLESLRRFDIPHLVIDNNSSDCSVQSIRTQLPETRIIQNSENIGFARAVNQGVNETEGPYILVINPDARLITNVDPIIEFLTERKRAGVIGGLVLNPDHTRQPSCRGIPTLVNFPFGRTSTLTKIFPRNPLTRSMLLSEINYRIPQKIPAVCGSFMFIRREAFNDIGGMDGRFFLYVEDVDLCKRMWDKGWEVWFHPGAGCIHYYGESHRNNIVRSRIHHLRSMLYFLKKHYKPGIFIYPLLQVGAGLSAIYFLSWFRLKRRLRWQSSFSS